MQLKQFLDWLLNGLQTTIWLSNQCWRGHEWSSQRSVERVQVVVLHVGWNKSGGKNLRREERPGATGGNEQLMWFDKVLASRPRNKSLGLVFVSVGLYFQYKAYSLTSLENTLPVTLLVTMWELLVKILNRTGQWYFPEAEGKRKV